MNNLQTILKQFRKDMAPEKVITHNPKEQHLADIVYDIILFTHEKHIKQAYLAGAEEHSRLSEVKTPKKEAYNMSLLELTGYTKALKRGQEASEKALQQIKDTVL